MFEQKATKETKYGRELYWEIAEFSLSFLRYLRFLLFQIPVVYGSKAPIGAFELALLVTTYAWSSPLRWGCSRFRLDGFRQGHEVPDPVEDTTPGRLA